MTSRAPPATPVWMQEAMERRLHGRNEGEATPGPARKPKAPDPLARPASTLPDFGPDWRRVDGPG